MAVAGVSRECRDNIKDFASREGLRMCTEGEELLRPSGAWTPEGFKRRCEVPGAWRISAVLENAPDVAYTVALNDAEILRHRLSRGDAELRRDLTEMGDGNAIYWAVAAGADESLRLFVERFGLAVDLVNSFGESLLHVAANWGRTAMCRYLVQRGADPRRTCNDGQTALHFAICTSPETIRYLVREAGCRDMIDRATVNGSTPVKLAAGYRRDCAMELLASGADIDIRDSNRAKALHGACLAGAGAPMVTLLLDAGCDPTERDARGETPADDARNDDDNRYRPLRRAHRAETLALLARGTPAQQAKTRGNRHALKKRWAEAEAAYTESIETNSAPAVQGRTGKLRREALTNRALMRIHLGRWADALADCDAALELDPDNVKALMRRAKCRRELGDEAGAREDAALVVRLDPREKSAVEAIAGLTL